MKDGRYLSNRGGTPLFLSVILREKKDMSLKSATRFDQALARVCEICPVCSLARREQEGIAFRIVRNVEEGICPFCMAYERIHGRKAHEPSLPYT